MDKLIELRPEEAEIVLGGGPGPIFDGDPPTQGAPDRWSDGQN